MGARNSWEASVHHNAPSPKWRCAEPPTRQLEDTHAGATSDQSNIEEPMVRVAQVEDPAWGLGSGEGTPDQAPWGGSRRPVMARNSSGVKVCRLKGR